MKITRLSLWLILILFSLGFATQTFALPFSIVTKAGTTLPSGIAPGQTLTAYYTVTNNSSITLTGNFVKYLPTNVTQITTPDAIATDPCGSTFTLTALGTGPTSSCTLRLLITGPVIACSSGNCDPHECLFVCTSGGATCAGTPNPLNVPAVPPPVFVSVGIFDLEGFSHKGGKPNAGLLKDVHKTLAKKTYARRQVTTQNLAYRSTDGGSSWINAPVPLLGFDPELNGVTCFGNNCVAVGDFGDSVTFTLRPSTYISSDHGASWTASIPPPPEFDAGLRSVACQGNLCVAVGAEVAPLGYFSTNSGASWEINSPIESATAFTALQSVSCPTHNCVVVGYANVSDPTPAHEAISYTTPDVGQTYSAVNVIPRVQPGFISELFGVSCIANGHCVAVGRYITDTSESRPLAYTSNDFGATWTEVLPTPPATSAFTQLTGVSCVSNLCAAVGFFIDTVDTLNKPVSYTSSDGGSTWTLSTTLPPASSNTAIFKVSCVSGGLCNAVGVFESTTVNRPITYRSNDFGDTWTAVFPPYQGSGDSFLFDIAS